MDFVDYLYTFGFFIGLGLMIAAIIGATIWACSINWIFGAFTYVVLTALAATGITASIVHNRDYF